MIQILIFKPRKMVSPKDEFSFIIEEWLEAVSNKYNDINSEMRYCFILFLLLFFIFVSKTSWNKLKNSKKLCDLQEKEIAVTDIHYAACYCSKSKRLEQQCMMLLKKYPDVCNIPLPPQQYTPFLRACWNGCTDLINFMIEYANADINAQTACGDSAFYLATYNIAKKKSENFFILKLLLSKGADINGAKNNGYTPLHVAAAKGHNKLVKWLLSKGANPHPYNINITPKHVALYYGHKETASLLEIERYDDIISDSISNKTKGSEDTDL